MIDISTSWAWKNPVKRPIGRPHREIHPDTREMAEWMLNNGFRGASERSLLLTIIRFGLERPMPELSWTVMYNEALRYHKAKR